MSRDIEVARSKHGGRHRRRRARPAAVLQVVTGLTALTVAALAVIMMVRPAGDPPASAAAPAATATAAPGVSEGDGPGGGPGVTAADAGGAKAKKKDNDATASGPSKHTDTEAVDYFKRRWTADKSVKRITDIRTVGKYLRIYTDLPASKRNSKAAIDLCKRGMEYLVQEIGDEHPVVFVQAEFGQNGNPVLANILGGGDHSCRFTSPDPGK
ncbi:hypothetical protein ABGB17_24645 [Sphaerisporangium sp. B11E5]|uniref:hypothetical protein n=1 Tax=Sphaerisporangium sp. B11E5 TaxID=3153563 RepID=UPI00325F6897